MAFSELFIVFNKRLVAILRSWKYDTFNINNWAGKLSHRTMRTIVTLPKKSHENFGPFFSVFNRALKNIQIFIICNVSLYTAFLS